MTDARYLYRSYDNPLVISYGLGLQDFGGSSDATAIQKPLGKRFCKVLELHTSITEVFAGTTTSAMLRLGTASDPDKFAELIYGTAADTEGWGTNDDPDAIKAAGQMIDMVTDGDAGAEIDQIELNIVAATGSPTGQGYTTIVLAWW